MDAADLRVEHGKAVMAANRKLHDAGALVDVTVTVGDVSFPCHKFLLAAWSGFFRSMFSSNFTESRASQVTLTETSLLSSEAFVVLHSWMYRGELNLTPDSADIILSAAFYLQMDMTVDMLTDYIKRQYSGNVPVARMFRHLNLAQSCGIPHLQGMALAGLAKNFDELVEAEEILELNPEYFLRLLCMDQLQAESEDVVFRAAFAWLHHSEDRLDYLRDVLKSLRIGLVSTGTIQKALDAKIMSKDSECSNILLDCLAAGHSDEQSLQRLTKDVHELFVKRTPTAAQREHGGSSDGHKSVVRLLQEQDPRTLYSDTWREAYANFGDSGPDMCDVTVTVDGEDFRCHKAVLFGWSEYFTKRFLVDEGSTVSDDWLPGEISATHREDDLRASDRPSPPMENASGSSPRASQGSVESALKSPPGQTPQAPEYQDTLNASSYDEKECTVSYPDRPLDGNDDPDDCLPQSADPACGRSRDSLSHVSLTSDCMTRNVFRILLDWIYRGQLKVTTNNLCDVMKCARCLQMHRVVKVVSVTLDHYFPTLVGGEIVTMLHTAKKCDLADAYEACFSQIIAKFDEVWVSPEFKELLDIETLLRLLQDDRLNVTSEDVVLQAALSWLRHSESRLGHISDVIKSIRLGLVEKAALSDGLDLAFGSRDQEAHAMLNQAAISDRQGVDSFLEDYPDMYRQRLGKARYDRMRVTGRLGDDSGGGQLKGPTAACLLGDLVLVTDCDSNRLVAFCRPSPTTDYTYFCHVETEQPTYCMSNKDRDTMYVSHYYQHVITIWKWSTTKKLHEVGRLSAGGKLIKPWHMTFDGEEHVYVACSDGLHRVSLATDKVVSTSTRPDLPTRGPGVQPGRVLRVAVIGAEKIVSYGAPPDYPDGRPTGPVVKPIKLKNPRAVAADGVNFLVGNYKDKCMYVVTPSFVTLTKVNTGGVGACNISVYGDNMYAVSYSDKQVVIISR